MEAVFGLPFELVVPDLLFERELRGHGGDDLVRRGLRVAELDGKGVARALGYRDREPSLSLVDRLSRSAVGARPDDRGHRGRSAYSILRAQGDRRSSAVPAAASRGKQATSTLGPARHDLISQYVRVGFNHAEALRHNQSLGKGGRADFGATTLGVFTGGDPPIAVSAPGAAGGPPARWKRCDATARPSRASGCRVTSSWTRTSSRIWRTSRPASRSSRPRRSSTKRRPPARSRSGRPRSGRYGKWSRSRSGCATARAPRRHHPGDP